MVACDDCGYMVGNATSEVGVWAETTVAVEDKCKSRGRAFVAVTAFPLPEMAALYESVILGTSRLAAWKSACPFLVKAGIIP